MANLFLCSALFVCLQVFKPTIFMEVYRFAFDFNPTLYSNWALYKMVWSNIQTGSMAANVMVPLLLAEAVWLFIPVAFYRFLTDKSAPRETNVAHKNNHFDQSTIFDPAKSSASHIIEVKHIEKAETFGEFLLNQNIKLEILSVEPHGGHLLKLTQYEHVAYARTTNLSVDSHQRFWSDGEKQHLPDQKIWHIEIAFMGNTRGMYTNVLNAVMEMNQHYPAKKIHDVKVRPYQALNALFEHSHSLRLPGNKKLVSIAYHGNELEIETQHEYEDTNVEYTRTTTVWLNDGGLICSESKGINEDITVSTEDVPLTYVELPFEQSRLKYIEIQQNEQAETHPTTLILTIEDTSNSQIAELQLQKLSIDLSVRPIMTKQLLNVPDKVLSITGYREQQCILLY